MQFCYLREVKSARQMFAPGPLLSGDASPSTTGLVEEKKEPEPDEEPLILPSLGTRACGY